MVAWGDSSHSVHLSNGDWVEVRKFKLKPHTAFSLPSLSENDIHVDCDDAHIRILTSVPPKNFNVNTPLLPRFIPVSKLRSHLNQEVNVMGVLVGRSRLERQVDGKKICEITLSDQTGSIRIEW